jgi:hypothetical protein
MPVRKRFSQAWPTNPNRAVCGRAERSECIENFRSLDRKRIAFSRAEVLDRYLAQRPTGSVGEMGVVRAEIGKRRGHLPIRRLLERAATAVQKIKPVFLMSPLSVAQFLRRGVPISTCWSSTRPVKLRPKTRSVPSPEQDRSWSSATTSSCLRPTFFAC